MKNNAIKQKLIDIYNDHIQECEFPEEMERLIAEFRKNPNDELLEVIESQFSTETIRKAGYELGYSDGKTEMKSVLLFKFVDFLNSEFKHADTDKQLSLLEEGQ